MQKEQKTNNIKNAFALQLLVLRTCLYVCIFLKRTKKIGQSSRSS